MMPLLIDLISFSVLGGSAAFSKRARGGAIAIAIYPIIWDCP